MQRSRDTVRNRRRFAAIAAALLLGAPIAAATVEPAPLSALIDPVDAEAPGVVAVDGATLLALDEARTDIVRRWIRRGGRLRLDGEAVPPALERLTGERHRNGSNSTHLGLGEISRPGSGVAAAPMGCIDGSRVFAAGRRRAGADLPSVSVSRPGTAARLALYAGLLAIAWGATRKTRPIRRLAGVGVLVLLFGSWNAWSRATPWGAPDWSRTDVIAVTGDGPALAWSIVGLRAGTRGTLQVFDESEAWEVSSLGEALDAGALRIDEAEGTAHIVLVRQQRVDLGWMADAPLEPGLRLSLSVEADRLLGVVSEEAGREWHDVWLVPPGHRAVRLENLPPWQTRLVDRRNESTPEDRLRAMQDDLTQEEVRLLDATLACVVEPLLDRDRSVLLAWADRPWHDSAPPGARALGTTLYVTVAEPHP